MQFPNVVSELRYPDRKMTYRFLGYRKLTRAEMLTGLKTYWSQPRFRRRKRPERNKVVTIVTIHGATPNI